jgi:hypothetical protein
MTKRNRNWILAATALVILMVAAIAWRREHIWEQVHASTYCNQFMGTIACGYSEDECKREAKLHNAVCWRKEHP